MAPMKQESAQCARCVNLRLLVDLWSLLAVQAERCAAFGRTGGPGGQWVYPATPPERAREVHERIADLANLMCREVAAWRSE